MRKNLTEGNPLKLLILYSIPLLGSVIFQQMYNIADSIIAGKFAGELALASVGASYPVTMIFIAIALGANMGTSIIIANYYGSKDLSKTKTCIYTSLIFFGLLSIILMIAGMIFNSPLLKLLNTPTNIFEDSKDYLNIYIYGLLFLFVYNIATGSFTAIGDSKTPFIILVMSTVLNVFLDLLFVAKLGYGVKGVAWATFISQGVSCVITFIILLYRLFKMKVEKVIYFSTSILKKILKMSVPCILQQSFVSVGNLFVQNRVNSFGTSVVAGYTSAIKYNTFFTTVLTTFSSGLANYTSSNLGAGKKERIKVGFNIEIVLMISVSLIFSIVYLVFGKSLIGLFMKKNESADAINVGYQFLKIVGPFYFVLAIKLAGDAITRGSQMVKAFTTSTLVDLILRVSFAFVLSSFSSLNEKGIWLSWPGGWIISSVIALGFCFNIEYMKRDKKDKLLAK